MSTAIEVATWIWTNIWQLIALFILFRYWNRIYHDLIFTPLAGGNGKVQMNELAQGLILIVFLASAAIEGFRKTEYHVFSDAYYFALLGTVAIIAGIKQGTKLMNPFKKPEEPKAP